MKMYGGLITILALISFVIFEILFLKQNSYWHSSLLISIILNVVGMGTRLLYAKNPIASNSRNNSYKIGNSKWIELLNWRVVQNPSRGQWSCMRIFSSSRYTYLCIYFLFIQFVWYGLILPWHLRENERIFKICYVKQVIIFVWLRKIVILNQHNICTVIKYSH